MTLPGALGTDHLKDTAYLIKRLAEAADTALGTLTYYGVTTQVITCGSGGSFSIDVPGINVLSGCVLQELYTWIPGANNSTAWSKVRGTPVLQSFNPGGVPGRIGGTMVAFNQSGNPASGHQFLIAAIAWGSKL